MFKRSELNYPSASPRNLLVSALLLLTLSFNAFAITCTELDGAYVYSGETSPVYLGFFGSQFATESIMYQFGTYGNQFNPLSVRNTVGTYGSAFSAYSANNNLASYPPKIYKYGLFIAYLTTNTIKLPGVSLALIDNNCTFFASSPANSGGSVPVAPTGVSASDGVYTDKVIVSWNAVQNATAYNVYISSTYGGSKTYLGQVAGTSATVTGSTPGVVFYFWIFAVNAYGESVSGGYDTGYIAEPLVAPNIPQSVNATDGTYSTKVQITWNDVANEDNYEVYRCASADTANCVKIAVPAANSVVYDDTGAAANGAIQYYRVKACNGGGCSDYSSSDSGYRSTGGGNNINNELRNISTRADVGTGNYIAIAGFIITGNGQKCVIVRGRGPSVNLPAGVSQLSDPMLTLKSGSTTIAENDDWQTQDNSDHVNIIQNLGFAPGDPLDAAIYACLDPGPYTALLRGFNSSTGVGIAEVLDVDDGQPYLRNIATRARVGTVNLVTIAGFIISGNVPKQILIRGRGPSVGVPAGVTRLANPILSLKSGQTTIGENDDWGDASNAADINATGQAPGDPADSAILIELQPGAYTAILRGVGGTTGTGMIEVLDLTGR